MARYKNVSWNLRTPENASSFPNEEIKIALLMDIRDELQSLNRLLNCHNFLDIPHKLDQIRRNTTKRKPRKLKVAK